MFLAGYLCPFLYFSFCYELNVSACHCVKASGILLAYCASSRSVSIWYISSLSLLFSPVLVFAALVAVCLAVPIHFRCSEFFSKTSKRWGVFPSPLSNIIFQCDNPWGFSPVDSHMDISFHNVSSCSGVSTLGFCGRLPQLISGHLCSESCSLTGGS